MKASRRTVAGAAAARTIPLSDYRALASFRYEIRKFLAFSEQAARSLGIEPQQHQLLLAVHGLPEATRPTIRAVAERLCVQHHTAVALVDKLETAALIERRRSQLDRREVLLRLTPLGLSLLRKLSILHREKLRSSGQEMLAALGVVLGELAGESGRVDRKPSRR